jgi:hypothetical protein
MSFPGPHFKLNPFEDFDSSKLLADSGHAQQRRLGRIRGGLGEFHGIQIDCGLVFQRNLNFEVRVRQPF